MSDVLNREDSPETALLWTREQEELLKEWGDIANCFRWLHEQASFKNRDINNKIALPVIILSTLTGTANFALDSLVSEQYKVLASAAIGGVNILCGILTTIQTYFKYAENTESHSSASKLWSKFQRVIQIELAIDPAKRKHPNEFLKYCIDEYNKLIETSPTIPEDIAKEFKHKFKESENIYKPDIYDRLTGTQTYINYLSRVSYNKKENQENKNELKSIRVDSDESADDKINIVDRRFSFPQLKPKSNAIGSNKIKTTDDIELGVMNVEKFTISAKDQVKKELEMIRPNIKELINKIETSKTPFTNPVDSPITFSDSVDEDKEKKENESKENNSNLTKDILNNVKNL